MARQAGKGGMKAKPGGGPIRYEAANLEGLFPVLDGIAWMDAPSTNQLAQFSGADSRTVGKLLKNAEQIGLVAKQEAGYVLLSPYPYDGTPEQKRHAVRDALLRLPLLVSVRQFLKLGDGDDDALRKAATVRNIVPFERGNFAPLMEWARKLRALEKELLEDVLDQAVAEKEARHQSKVTSTVVFLSHSSLDKPFIRQLAADLKSNGVQVWLDEQNIKVGESIPEKISQGLAESDYFLFASSKNSIESEWVKKELNSALVTEVEKRAVHVLPLKLDDNPVPHAIADKKYADFSTSYKQGLKEVLEAMGVSDA
jgi:hypothetical protein